MTKPIEIIGAKKDPNKPMTQKQVEDFILLASQNGERWFQMSFVDEDMNKDPTAMALMDALSDMINQGVNTVGFEERMSQANEDCKGVNVNGSH